MRKEVNTIQNSNKDILAKLMATENITVLHKKVPTAYFDIKNRTLVCPILNHDMSSELYDLFMGHEVSHALNTPLEGWHDQVSDKGMVFKGYLNVIEDIRIEKMIKAKYPGLRRSFYAGYNELAREDFFGIKDKGVSGLNLIDRINISFKLGSTAQVPFSKEEMVYIKRCEALKTFEEVLELATELFEKQKQETKDEVASMTQDELQSLLDDLGIDQPEDGEGSEIEVVVKEYEEGEEEGEEEGSSTANGDNQEDEENEEGTGEADSSDADNESDEQSEQKAPAGGKTPEEQLQDKLEDELNKSDTDESFRENEGKLIDDSAYTREPRYFELNNKIKYENFIVSYKDINQVIEDNPFERNKIQKYTKNFIDQNKKIINYMVKEFEMKKAAADYRRSQSAKTGEINMDKLHLYQLKDDIFNRVQVVPDGKNHGIVMIIDWSGSMSGSVQPTIEQASLLSMFCRRLQIPFRLFAFSDAYSKNTSREELEKEYKEKYGKEVWDLPSDIYKEYQQAMTDRMFTKAFGVNPFDETDPNSWHLGNLALLEIFNEKMSNSEFVRSMENWFQLGMSNDYYYSYDAPDFDNEWFAPADLRLGGTPLDHSLVLMRDYLKDFKMDYGLDITTFITLTDGSSHSCFHDSNAELVDRKLNKTFKLKGYYGNTYGLLDWVRETAGVRTIGFFLTKSSGHNWYREAESFSGAQINDWEDYGLEKKKEFNKLACTLEDCAYDLAIVINQKKIEIDYEEDELQVGVGANKGALKRALVKAGNNKMQQRVILNKFVQQMAV